MINRLFKWDTIRCWTVPSFRTMIEDGHDQQSWTHAPRLLACAVTDCWNAQLQVVVSIRVLRSKWNLQTLGCTGHNSKEEFCGMFFWTRLRKHFIGCLHFHRAITCFELHGVSLSFSWHGFSLWWCAVWGCASSIIAAKWYRRYRQTRGCTSCLMSFAHYLCMCEYLTPKFAI